MAHFERSMGASDEWFTPSYIFDGLEVRFDMDVAHPGLPSASWVPADEYVTQDSLSREWKGFIWANPPFGGRNGLVPWLDRFFAHGNGIILTPDRTSAPWWQSAAKKADAIMFMSPKVRFLRPDGSEGVSPSTGTTLMASGGKGVAALLRGACNGLGFVVFGATRWRIITD